MGQLARGADFPFDNEGSKLSGSDSPHGRPRVVPGRSATHAEREKSCLFAGLG